MSNKNVNVALVTDEKYALMTCMCINDIILNKKIKTELSFYVLLNNVSQNSKDILSKFSSFDKVAISLIDITEKCKEFEKEYDKIDEKKNLSMHVSGTAFMRCFLPEILNKIDKIIYLDQDIYVNGDLQRFFNIDIDKHLLAAPIDSFAMLAKDKNPSYEICKKSFDNKRYIQDGQMLMNLKKMRELKFLEKCISFLKEKLPPNKDMDVINAVACDHILPLDQSFCVPMAAIELARNKYLPPVYLVMKFYNMFIDTKYRTLEDLIKNGLIWHFYGNKEKDMSLCPELKKLFNAAKQRLVSRLKLNSKAFLIFQMELALGDTLVTTNFFKDFKEQYPEYTMYYKVATNHPYFCKQKVEIFKNNPNVSIYNGQLINKAIEYKCEKFFKASVHEDNVMNHSLYEVFKEATGIEVKQNTFGTDVYLTDDEKSDAVLKKFNIPTDKPICLICSGYHPQDNSIKYVGTKKLQNIVNALHDKVTFVQVGDTAGGYLHNVLNYAISLIDKTNIRDLILLMYQARYVVTGIHALAHLGSMISKSKRDVYLFIGCRENEKWFSSYLKLDDIKYHVLGYKPDENRKCLGNDKCCARDVTSESKLEGRKICLNVIERNGEKIASCMDAINENEIINDILNKL